jgi:hypothetical protein
MDGTALRYSILRMVHPVGNCSLGTLFGMTPAEHRACTVYMDVIVYYIWFTCVPYRVAVGQASWPLFDLEHDFTRFIVCSSLFLLIPLYLLRIAHPPYRCSAEREYLNFQSCVLLSIVAHMHLLNTAFR